MGRPRTFALYYCPYCNIGGWRRAGEFEAHVRKSHKRKVKAKNHTTPKQLKQ